MRYTASVTLRAGDGVLLVAHGTVTDLDDLPEFLARIRRGRPAPPELVQELRHRYEAIGGSPLLDITREQGQALARRLELPVLIAMRLWHPTVEEVLGAAVGLGLRRLCVLPLAPFSVHVYFEAAQRSLDSIRGELGERAPELVPSEPWGTEPEFVRSWAEAIARARGPGDESPVVLTAHSLPTRAIAAGDPYEAQVRACADAVARSVGGSCTVAFQSAGAGGGEWLGPDLSVMLRELAQRGERRVVVAPIGFVAEHVETLFDLDVEAARQARELGLELARAPVPNTDPGLIEALARVAERALA